MQLKKEKKKKKKSEYLVKSFHEIFSHAYSYQLIVEDCIKFSRGKQGKQISRLINHKKFSSIIKNNICYQLIVRNHVKLSPNNKMKIEYLFRTPNQREFSSINMRTQIHSVEFKAVTQIIDSKKKLYCLVPMLVIYQMKEGKSSKAGTTKIT